MNGFRGVACGLAALALIILALPANAAIHLQGQVQAGSSSPNATCPGNGQCFADVDSNNPFYEFINRIYQQDIVGGYPCGGIGEPCDSENRPYYRPSNDVNRQAMAKFIDNARRLPGIDIDGSSGGNIPIFARNNTGVAIAAHSSSGQALVAVSQSDLAIYAQTGDTIAIDALAADTNHAIGVRGTGYFGVEGISPATGGVGVAGIGRNASRGVNGESESSYGVVGISHHGAFAAGVYGDSENSDANTPGVYGRSSNGVGVSGYSSFGLAGVLGNGTIGVKGQSNGGQGVYGVDAGTGIGVSGESNSGWGVAGYSASGYGVRGGSSSGYAGYFSGNVEVTGSCCAMGQAYTRIDDPTDPANKYLNQALVQSPEMTTVINGNVVTDGKGEATVELPSWFGAANGDFRYSLTTVGQFAQAIVSQKVQDNRFVIKTEKVNVEVSWQVTGIRQDAYANAHPIQVEQEKPANQKGKYLHPVELGQPESLGVNYETRQSARQGMETKP